MAFIPKIGIIPSNTAAGAAVRGATELGLIIIDRLAAAGAFCSEIYAFVPTPPLVPLAAIHALAVVWEEEEEGEQQPALPQQQH